MPGSYSREQDRCPNDPLAKGARNMNFSNRARRATAVLAVATFAAPLAHGDAKAATHLDVTNLPCTPTCPKALVADANSVPTQKIVLKPDAFDWEDAGIGAGVGIALMLAGLASALEARKHRIVAR
jgi:hypothetical protein